MSPKRLERSRDRARSAAGETRRQASAGWRNFRGFVGSFGVDRAIPNGMASLVQEIMAILAYAAGRGSPSQQVYASITGIVFAIVVSPLTLGYSLALAVPFAITLGWGLLRFVPAINDRFQEARGNRLRDRDVPLWQRD